MQDNEKTYHEHVTQIEREITTAKQIQEYILSLFRKLSELDNKTNESKENK